MKPLLIAALIAAGLIIKTDYGYVSSDGSTATKTEYGYAVNTAEKEALAVIKTDYGYIVTGTEQRGQAAQKTQRRHR